MQYLHLNHPFPLESGQTLDRLTICYTTYGQLNAARDNVVWVAHALTGNADPVEWWGELVGSGRVLDPANYFIVCANMLGSCYGTSGPTHYAPGQSSRYGLEFPLVTTRDMARAHELLSLHLGIDHIYLGIGGSMGGQQLLEWAIEAPQRFEQLCLLATNAKHSPWGIAFNEAQRMALQSDPTLGTDQADAGRAGLAAARAVAMLSYRHYQTYGGSQQEADDQPIDNFRASSYQQYQGQKLWQRFDPAAYWVLSKAMDSHNVGRKRGGVAAALGRITAHTLVVGIDTDLLFPVIEQSEIAEHIPLSRFEVITSDFGHDGFLTETATIKQLLQNFLQVRFNGRKPAPLLNKRLAFRGSYVLPGSEAF
ncbi:MAG: homoserine O-acetyltransferase [Bacteroidota bacterium]